MAETAEEKAARKKDLAEAFAEGLEIFETKKAEKEAKAQTVNPPPASDTEPAKSFTDKLLGWL